MNNRPKFVIITTIALLPIPFLFYSQSKTGSRKNHFQETKNFDQHHDARNLRSHSSRRTRGAGKHLSPQQKALIDEITRDFRAREKQRCETQKTYLFDGVHHIHFKVTPLNESSISDIRDRLSELKSAEIDQETISELKNQYGLNAPEKEYRFLVTYNSDTEEFCSSRNYVNEFGEEVFNRTTTTLTKVQKSPEEWRYSHMVDLIPEIRD